MKRLSILFVALLLVAGCSGSKTSGPKPAQAGETPASPVSQTGAPRQAPAPPPAEPTLREGPIRLLPTPSQPLWAGPVAVVVENSPQARPQVGLQEADLVVELLAESEISRFLAFYWSNPVEKIGPVRSARIGLVAMAEAYHAPLAHAGANNDALAILQTQWGARDLDEIYGGTAFFWRSNDREPPHNLYTSTKLLDRAITVRKLAMKPVPTTERSASLPAPGVDGARVAVRWHRLHQVRWEWKGDRYLRFEDGEPHLAESGQQLWAANLVFLNIKGVNNGPDLGWTLDFKSGGKATVLVAGHKWEGTWSLEDGGFVLKPANGAKAILLAPSTTWVHLITQESDFAIE